MTYKIISTKVLILNLAIAIEDLFFEKIVNQMVKF